MLQISRKLRRLCPFVETISSLVSKKKSLHIALLIIFYSNSSLRGMGTQITPPQKHYYLPFKIRQTPEEGMGGGMNTCPTLYTRQKLSTGEKVFNY